MPKCISLGQNETLLLYNELGENVFNSILTAFGVQTPSPLSFHYRCHGIAGYFDCSGSSHPDSNTFISCIAVDKPWHPFRGMFVCNNCHRKVERAELSYYESNLDSINDDQKMRMHELTRRKELHRNHVQSTYIYDASKTRKKRNIAFESMSENERRAVLDKKARQSKERGDVKKSTVETRAIRTKRTL